MSMYMLWEYFHYCFHLLFIYQLREISMQLLSFLKALGITIFLP